MTNIAIGQESPNDQMVTVVISAILAFVGIYMVLTQHRAQDLVPQPPTPPLLLDTPPPIFGAGNPKKRVLGPFGASMGALRAPQGAKNVF